MAEFKRRTLLLDSGKQIKLFGNSMAIGRSLEIGEGASPNIFSSFEQQPNEQLDLEIIKDHEEMKPAEESKQIAEGRLKEGKAAKKKPPQKSTTIILNPYKLTTSDLMEIADYNIRLWLDLKDNIRKFGINNPKVFNQDAVR